VKRNGPKTKTKVSRKDAKIAKKTLKSSGFGLSFLCAFAALRENISGFVNRPFYWL